VPVGFCCLVSCGGCTSPEAVFVTSSSDESSQSSSLPGFLEVRFFGLRLSMRFLPSASSSMRFFSSS